MRQPLKIVSTEWGPFFKVEAINSSVIWVLRQNRKDKSKFLVYEQSALKPDIRRRCTLPFLSGVVEFKSNKTFTYTRGYNQGGSLVFTKPSVKEVPYDWSNHYGLGCSLFDEHVRQFMLMKVGGNA